MAETARIIYEKAHALRLHQDNLRWTILGGYFALMGGVLTLLEKGNLSPDRYSWVARFAFSANNLILLIMAVENWYYNLFTEFIHYCEDCLIDKFQPKSLEQFTKENRESITVFHYSYFFVYLIVILANVLFASQYLWSKPAWLWSSLYFAGWIGLLLFWRQTVFRCLDRLRRIFARVVGFPSKGKKPKGTEQSGLTEMDKPRSRIVPVVAVIGSILTILICIFMYLLDGIYGVRLLVVFLQLEGTVLLASSISFDIPGIGKSFWSKIKWAILEFPKYASPAAFYPLWFYFGLLLLFSGITIGFW
jgi:hypothetical protein